MQSVHHASLCERAVTTAIILEYIYSSENMNIRNMWLVLQLDLRQRFLINTFNDQRRMK